MGFLLKKVFEMLQAGHSMKEPYLEKKLRDYQNQQFNVLARKLNINVQVPIRLLQQITLSLTQILQL